MKVKLNVRFWGLVSSLTSNKVNIRALSICTEYLYSFVYVCVCVFVKELVTPESRAISMVDKTPGYGLSKAVTDRPISGWR